MSTSALLASAANTVTAVIAKGQSLDDALESMASTVSEAEDAAALQALSYGTLRWYTRLDYWQTQLLERGTRPKPRIGGLLAVALHQLAFSNHPPHAIVDQAVDAARELGEPRAAGLVNAILRRFLRERERLGAAAEEFPPARFAHPAWLMERIRHDWPDHWRKILEANNQAPPMWLRVNRRRTSPAEYLAALASESLNATRSELAPDALLLETPVPVTRLPGFESGAVSVQDAGAQLAAQLLAVGDRMRVLDACAAPGGKACHLLEQADVELVAVDRSAERLEALRENLRRLQLAASVIVGDAADTARWWDSRPFERILLDAPCTATGVIRRHPDVKLLRRASDIDSLRREQLRLLGALWPLLAPGGRLLYVTCSVLRAENDEVVEAFLTGEPSANSVPIPEGFGPAGVRVNQAGIQFLPGEAGLDGFYYACLEKRHSGASAGNPSA
ncbi:MAG TPA: 16S rRNA (cytosine(967)-C(5))-methyltransferase RsmB [Steroidobacteraceae bacterium]|nr:16S rRNA (cytosine(967)-C(5))-methyltransferase RsmB [Steroidobacteraceae bacterium]